MPFHSGSIDPGGNPRIKITVSNEPAQEGLMLEPIVDTGFTGFLMISLQIARRLGITPLAAGTATMADGTISAVQSGIGVIGLSDKFYMGMAILADVPEPLLGMEFLRTAKHALYVDRHVVTLMDEAEADGFKKLFA